MRIRIFYSIIILFFISTATAFAQEPLLSVKTDDNNYDEGDTVVISGFVSTVIGKTPIIIQIIHEATYVHLAQVEVSQEGSFIDTVIVEGALWKKAGVYTVIAHYQEYITETEFSYTPKSELTETTTNFEVDAGNQGTFDVEYTIKGGTVENMIVDSNIFAIIIQIDSTDEGTITLDLPREFIGAEKQDGKDITFIILIDGIEVTYQELVVNSDSRVIIINFEEADSVIEIIGTYVIPEFGTFVMIILIVGIMTIILASRNKFQINV